MRLESRPLSLLSWNVHAIPLLSTQPEQRLGRIAEKIRELAPDVVLLQELWTPAHRELLVDRVNEDASLQFDAIDNVGTIIGFDPLFPVVGQLLLPVTLFWRWRKSGLFALVRRDGPWTIPPGYRSEERVFHEYENEASDFAFLEQDAHGDKGVQRVRVRHRDGVEVMFYNTHLQAEYGEESTRYAHIRRKQIDELTRFAEQTSEGLPVVCAGDFNTAAHDTERGPGWYDRETWDHMSGSKRWIDLTREHRLRCREETPRWLCSTHVSDDGESTHWIDYILTRAPEPSAPAWRVGVEGLEVFPNLRVDDPWSDHHGLYATLSIETPPRTSATAPTTGRALGAAAVATLCAPSSRRAWLLASGALAVSVALGEIPSIGSGGREDSR